MAAAVVVAFMVYLLVLLLTSHRGRALQLFGGRRLPYASYGFGTEVAPRVLEGHLDHHQRRRNSSKRRAEKGK